MPPTSRVHYVDGIPESIDRDLDHLYGHSVHGNALQLGPWIFYVVYTVIVTATFLYYGVLEHVNLSAILNTPVALLSMMLFVLMSFRTGSCFARWTEARQQLDTIHKTCINMGRVACLLLDDHEWQARFMRWTIAWSIACKQELRMDKHPEEMAGLLPDGDIARLYGATSLTVYASRQLTQLAVSASYKSAVSMSFYRTLDKDIASLFGAYIACTRIRDCPFPYAYVLHLRSFEAIWLGCAPFLYVGTLGWWAIPICAILGFQVMGLEGIGLEIEEPFGGGINDLPLDEITADIQETLAQTLTHSLEDVYGSIGRPKPLAQVKVASPELFAGDGATGEAGSIVSSAAPRSKRWSLNWSQAA